MEWVHGLVIPLRTPIFIEHLRCLLLQIHMKRLFGENFLKKAPSYIYQNRHYRSPKNSVENKNITVLLLVFIFSNIQIASENFVT